MEWLNDKSEQINKPLKSDSAEETEVLVERVENVISQLEKKKKVKIFKYNLYISHYKVSSLDQISKLLFANIKSKIHMKISFK